MEINYNSRFYSLLLITALSVSFWGVSTPREQYENNTSCRSIYDNEERVGAFITGFNGKSIDVSRLISNRVNRNDVIASLRIQASPDTSSMARVVVNGRSSDWYYPKVYRDYRDYYTVYCFDDIYIRVDSDIEVQFNSSGAKPRNIVMFLRSK